MGLTLQSPACKTRALPIRQVISQETRPTVFLHSVGMIMNLDRVHYFKHRQLKENREYHGT